MKKIEVIKQRLQQAFSPQQLEVIDESNHHIGHTGHQGGERHFFIIIQAAELDGLSRVAAHRKIYSLFVDMIPHEIHALKITIIQSKM